MSSDVVLTAAMRSNLLSLQTTQNKIDDTQYRLATGLKVNSALDNPQSFFAAKSLTNRAADLSALLDGMGQSIQTIKQADTAVTSLEGLLDQADAIATEARSAVDSGGAQATATGSVSFTGSDNITSYTNISGGDTITFSFTDENGKAITIDANSGEDTAGLITLSDNETVDEIIAQINAIEENNTNEQLVEASLTDDGYLQLKSLSGGDMRLAFSSATVDNGLGLSSYGGEELTDVDNTFTPDQYAVTISKSPALSSYTLYDSTGAAATRSTALDSLYYKDPSSGTLTALMTNADSGDSLIIGLNAATPTEAANTVASDVTTDSVQDLIDGINSNATLKNSISASFNEDTGQIEIRAIDSTAKSIQFIASAEAGSDAFTIQESMGFGFTDLTATDNGDNNYSSESIAFGVGAGQLAQLETDYNTILTQIDDLVGDSSYRGTNLLTGDTLTTYFNEDQSSFLSTQGADLTTGSSGLNLSSANFSSLSNIAASITEIGSATDTVRNFSSSLANSLSVIQNREDFTSSTINTLTEGADKLTVADQNEEGAKLLALQTRQQLGVTSLSLASQSQQSVLRLF